MDRIPYSILIATNNSSNHLDLIAVIVYTAPPRSPLIRAQYTDSSPHKSIVRRLPRQGKRRITALLSSAVHPLARAFLKARRKQTHWPLIEPFFQLPRSEAANWMAFVCRQRACDVTVSALATEVGEICLKGRSNGWQHILKVPFLVNHFLPVEKLSAGPVMM